MRSNPVKGSSKESATKVDARDDNMSHSGEPQAPLSKQPPAKGRSGASAKEQQDSTELSDPPLRKGLHESVPRD